MFEIEVDIFSGMPNPIFYLNSRQARGLLDRLIADPTQITLTTTSTSALYAGKLGYRGLMVRLVKEDATTLSSFKSVHGVDLPEDFSIFLDTSPSSAETTTWLVSNFLPGNNPVSQYVHTSITREIEALRSGVSVNNFRKDLIVVNGAGMSCASSFHLDNRSSFNANDRINFNNCYCFAANHLHSSSKSGRSAAPGVRSGMGAFDINKDLRSDRITARLISDGWRHSCVPKNNLRIVCVVSSNDFHFYRATTPSRWCHKRGITQATNVDASGKEITDPINCDRGDYRTFIGYFYQDNNTAYVDQ